MKTIAALLPSSLVGFDAEAIDATDPHAGVKVLWNYCYNYYWSGNSHNVIELVWVSPNGVDRKAGQDVWFKYYDGVPVDFKPANPQNLLSQFLTNRPSRRISTAPRRSTGAIAIRSSATACGRTFRPFALDIPGGGWRATFRDVPTFGFQQQGWKGSPWALLIGNLARRKVWILEGVPKDRYYLYGKIELSVDSQNWQGAYNRKFTGKASS